MADILIKPGESLTFYPYYYHEFIVEQGTGSVLIGEVSMCNDDERDNRFFDAVSRFSAIVEDEVPLRLLCGEYDHVDDRGSGAGRGPQACSGQGCSQADADPRPHSVNRSTPDVRDDDQAK